mgnify:CR=1 FL=1
MVDVEVVARFTLTLMRLVSFALAFGLTVISFQAYREKKTDTLQFAFVGFAFISMGVAISTVITQLGEEADPTVAVYLQMAETIPFIIGFSMLYLSLYR